MYIGGKFEKKPCSIANSASNRSILLTGQSGSGKSCTANIVELEAVKNGDTIIGVDCSQNHQEKFLLPQIRDEYTALTHRIDAVEDGLNLSLFKALKGKEKEENLFNIISSNVTAFSAGNCMGVKQKATLRKVIEHAIKIQELYDYDDSEALVAAFNYYQEDGKCEEVYQKLWTIIHSNVFRKGEGKVILPNRINIIDLKNLEVSSAEILAEIILAYLWRITSNVGWGEEFGNIIISLDEFQHFSLKRDAVLRTILREGRRFHVSLLLSTQTTSIFQPSENAMLYQSATRLVFRPGDNELTKMAVSINPDEAEKWRKELASLKVGEFIAVGNKVIESKEYVRPLKLKGGPHHEE